MTTPGSTSQPTPSFASYVQARRPVLMRTARSLTADPNDAEDLLQTALTKTYLAWERIADHRAVDGYIRRTLINTRTSQWRKRRVDEYSVHELPEPDTTPATSDPAEHKALQHAMWQAVLQLPARQRAMVVLRYYEDLSEVRTAEVLGVSVGTVKSAVSRALAKLRENASLADLIGRADEAVTDDRPEPATPAPDAEVGGPVGPNEARGLGPTPGEAGAGERSPRAARPTAHRATATRSRVGAGPSASRRVPPQASRGTVSVLPRAGQRLAA